MEVVKKQRPVAPLEEQAWRLMPAQVLSKAGIPCLVYGEDALFFVHFVPTLYFDYHLVVADEDQERASAELMRTLGFQIFTGVEDNFNESIVWDPNRTRIYQNSTHLNHINRDCWEMILVHPQSHFNLDIHDYTRSVSLPPFPNNIRFPTRAAFLDSLFDTYLDPNSGRYTIEGDEILQTWIDYLLRTLRNKPVVLPNGDLEPEHAELKSSLKPENQAYFDMIVRSPMNSFKPQLGIKMRKEVYRRLGRFDLADRPVATGPSGNPQFLPMNLVSQNEPLILLPSPTKRSYSTLAAANNSGFTKTQKRRYPTSMVGPTMSSFTRVYRFIRRL